MGGHELEADPARSPGGADRAGYSPGVAGSHPDDATPTPTQPEVTPMGATVTATVNPWQGAT